MNIIVWKKANQNQLAILKSWYNLYNIICISPWVVSMRLTFINLSGILH